MYIPNDPWSAYRFGVEQATTTETATSIVLDPNIRAFLEDRRKKLLTRKVTKWVSVYQSGCQSGEELESSGTLYDSSEEALMGDGRTRYTPKRIGVFPIEIEIPV